MTAVQAAGHLSGTLGYALLFGLGAFLLVIAVSVRSFVRSTHDFVIAGRRIGLGFGVGSVIAVWTWSMAVLMSSAQAYSWGTSGLIWFIVPNGLAVVAVVPLALKLRKHMPHGYTIVEFIRARFSSRTATIVILAAQIFGLLSEIFINLFGLVLVTGVIFGLDPTAVLLVTLATVTIYSYFGGLWTSAITATINTLLITIPAALVVLFVLAKVGGPSAVFHDIDAKGGELLNPFSPATAAAFGISLALGLLASTIADQTFWQKLWALRPGNLRRTFVWGGLWFYPIPLALGLLGLVGLGLGVTPDQLGEAGAGGIGPYVVANVGLPVILIVAYVLVILNACYSSIDGAFSALSSLVAVDILKQAWPKIREKRLFQFTKLSLLIGGGVGAIVVSSGIDYIALVNLVFFIKAVLIFPLLLAIFWRRTTGAAFVASIVAGLAVGLPLRQSGHDLLSIAALEGVSLLVVVGVSLLQRKKFDLDALRREAGELEQIPVLEGAR